MSAEDLVRVFESSAPVTAELATRLSRTGS